MTRDLPFAASASSKRWRRWVKRYRAGRALEAAWRTGRALVRGARAGMCERLDRRAGRIPPPAPRRRDVQAVVMFVSGPGRTGELLDSIESVITSEGERAQIIVVDDCSIDAREAVIRDRYPEVEVVRLRIPVLGPPNITPLTMLGLRHALGRYRFEHCIKMDSDALVTGPNLSDAIESRIGEIPDAGLVGAHLVRCDGVAYDNASFHEETLRYEARRDRTIAAAGQRAMANGWTPGEIVEGGICSLTRKACEALARDRWLHWRPLRGSIISEDLALSAFVRASGLELVQLGGPDGIFAVDTKVLPLSKHRIVDERWMAVHSVKQGVDGESETVLRRFFREDRSRWHERRAA